MPAMRATTTNLSLLEAARTGRDPRAWQEFFLVYAPLLAAFARRVGLTDADTHDAIQETMLAVCTAFRKMTEPFDRSKGRFKAWLRGIALHKIRDLQRRRARAEAAHARRALENGETAIEDPAAEALFEAEWQRHRLHRALSRVATEIDPAVYQAFELCALHGEPPARVAQLLGVSRNAVYISKTRVLQRLRRVLAQLAEEEG
jgi:RNA polymerase sigma-70 factor, ECF subfamily